MGLLRKANVVTHLLDPAGASLAVLLHQMQINVFYIALDCNCGAHWAREPLPPRSVHVVTNNYALSTFLSFLACLEDEKWLVCMYTGCCLITPKSKSSKNRANRHDVWHSQICCTLLSLSHRCVVVFVTYQRWHHPDCELPCGNPLTPHNCLTAFASVKICACVSLICLRGAAICWGGGRSNGDCLSSESLTGWSAGLDTDNCLKEEEKKKKYNK